MRKTSIFNYGTGGGTLTLLAHTYATGISTGVTTSAIDTSGANILIALCPTYSGSSTTPMITDSKSNIWVRVRYDYAGTSPNFLGTAIYYCASPTVGAGHTFTAPTFSSIVYWLYLEQILLH